jgi:hypothetical protein
MAEGQFAVAGHMTDQLAASGAIESFPADIAVVAGVSAALEGIDCTVGDG